MEHLKAARSSIRNRSILIMTISQLVAGLGVGFLVSLDVLSWPVGAGVFAVSTIALSVLLGHVVTSWATQPLEALGQAVLHLSPDQHPTAAPQFDNLHIGREYVTNIAYQLYQIASLQDNKDLAEHRREATQASNILTRLPLPIFVFNKQQIVTFGSDSALSYAGLPSAEVFGKALFEIMDLAFPTDFTLESWITDCQKNKATDTAYWRRVRLQLKDEDETMRQCDIAGYYNRDNPGGIEFIITLFDRTSEYSQDDQALGYMALAVHELRTPLTLMRGYIELFQDELQGKLNPEMANFMQRLQASAQQLASFVNNILNVARVEENQLAVKLAEENWSELINHAVQDMSARADAAHKTIQVSLPDTLPTVAADRLTIYEVLCNLLDNAIKYSGKTNDIKISVTLTTDNLVETVIEDKGVGIPAAVMPTLFEKFHRSHTTRSQVSGTGLGLYLSKAIVNAHGGEISVRSKENEGATVSFTLKPYAQLAEELKSGNNSEDMVRTAHGWIKNHSLYRR